MEIGEVTGVAAIEIQKESCARTGVQLAFRERCMFVRRGRGKITARFAQVRRGQKNIRNRDDGSDCLRHARCSCTLWPAVKLRASSQRGEIGARIFVWAAGKIRADSQVMLMLRAFPAKEMPDPYTPK